MPMKGCWGLVCFSTREPLSSSRMVQKDDSPSTLGAYGVRLRVHQATITAIVHNILVHAAGLPTARI